MQVLSEQTLVCSKCQEVKPTSGFSVRAGRARGYASWCRSCHGLHQKVSKNNRLTVLVRHGLTYETYEALLVEQGGVCAICKGFQCVGGAGKSDHFDIDHDHVTGKVRGLLCRNCNIAIGQMQDDPARLRAAASYLEVARG